MTDFLFVLRRLLTLFNEKRLARSSAALSYYLTMTLFPLIVCLYALLGDNYTRALQILGFLEQFLSAEATRLLRGFLFHVATSNSKAILAAGLMLLLSSSSAAVRCLQSSIGELQGGQRFHGLMDLLFSVVFSLAFLAAIYFAILVMFTSRDFLDLINGYLPFVDVSRSWQWLRFVLLAAIEFVIFWGVYEASERREEDYRSFPGALLATAATVAMSVLFSLFIGASTRYPLVYGSIASLVLLMFWLYLSCQIILLGAALNVCLRDLSRERNGEKEN